MPRFMILLYSIFCIFVRLCRLLHDKNVTESRLASKQAVDSSLDIRQRELFNHALDAVCVGEANGLLAVESVATGPPLDAAALDNEANGIELDRTDGCKAEKLAARRETTNKAANDLRVGSSLHNDGSTTKLHQLGRAILGLAVDIVVSAQLLGKIGLVVARGQHGDLVAHLVGVLNSQMTQATESLHGDQVTLLDTHLADAVEDGHTGAQQRRDVGRAHLLGDADDGLGAQDDVLGIAAIPAEAIDLAILASLEETALA